MCTARWMLLVVAFLGSVGCRGRVGGHGATGAAGGAGPMVGGGGMVGSGGLAGAGGAAGMGGTGGARLVYDRGLYGDGPGPRALYLDGNDLIWAEIAPEGPIVMRAPKDGSGPVTTIGTWLDGDRTLRLFAVDTDTIYWLHGWQIHRVRKTGEQLPPLEMGMGHVSGGGLISDGDVLRVADWGCTAIGFAPKNGAPPTYISNPGVTFLGGGTDIAVDADHVYCAHGPNVFALPKGGQVIETWVSDQEMAAPMVATDTTLFWANNRQLQGTGQENLASMSKEAPRTVSVLGTVGRGIGGIVFDSARRTLYGVSVSALGRVFSHNAETGRFTVMLDNTPIFGGFAHDETYVYWVSDTKIWRLPKDAPLSSTP